MASLMHSRALTLATRRAFSRISSAPQLAVGAHHLHNRHTAVVSWHPPCRFNSSATSTATAQLQPLESNASPATVERSLQSLKANYAKANKKDIVDWFATSLPLQSAPQTISLILSSLSHHIRSDKAFAKLVIETSFVPNRLGAILASASAVDTTSVSLSNLTAATDVLTALVSASHPSTGMEVVGVTDENPLGLGQSLFDFALRTSNPALTTATLELLAEIATLTVSSADKVSSRLPQVLTFLTSDHLVGPTSLVLVRAALAVLRKLSFYGDIAQRLNENILSIAIHAVRANSSDHKVVTHALGFLGNMREAVYREKSISLGVVTEIDYVLTIIDAMQSHSSDPLLVTSGFKFLLAINPEDPVIGRVGMYHAGVVKQLLTRHMAVADVQVYGLLAAEVMAKSHASMFNKTGLLEHCDKIQSVFYNNVYVRNCASFLAHTLRKTTRDKPHNFTSLPPDWDTTAGGPGTMLKLEGDGLTTYIGGYSDPIDLDMRQAFSQDAHDRGLDAVSHLEQPFSDDEMEGIIDMGAGTTDDDVPDLELADHDADNEVLSLMVEEELKSYAALRGTHLEKSQGLRILAPMNLTVDDVEADQWIAPPLTHREYAKDQHKVQWAVGHLKTIKRLVHKAEKAGIKTTPIKVRESGDIELKVWKDDIVMAMVELSMNRGSLVDNMLVGLDESTKAKKAATEGEKEGENAQEGEDEQPKQE